MNSGNPAKDVESRPFTGKNRREKQRYTVARNLAYRLVDDTQTGGWRKGRVLDMSSGGIRIEAAALLPEDTVLEIVMDWPGLYHGRDSVRLFLKGTVCRRDDAGTVLRITSHDFRFAAVEIPGRLRRPERKLAVA
jgi:hypothetical protein